MINRLNHLSAYLLALLMTSACTAGSVTNSPSDRDLEWSNADWQGSNFDAQKLSRINAALESGQYRNIHMLLIEQNGRPVLEKYLHGDDEIWGVAVGQRSFDQDSLHDLRSISKSVTSLLLGIALGDDFETALQRPILDYFPQIAADAAPGAERVTLHHVLSMTAGFEWNEMDIPYSTSSNDARRMYYTDDPVRYALTRPLANRPGKRWYYNGGMTMVLAAVIERVTGQEFLQFANEQLGRSLDIDEAQMEWRGRGIWRDRPRLPSAASGMRSTARSLARIGRLVLNGGRWRGQQIVPREWIEVSTRRHTEQSQANWSLDGTYGYGYQWWHGNFRGQYGDYQAIVGVGYGGQRLFIVPDRDLVVTVFAGNYRSGLHRESERLMAEIIAAMN